MDKELHEIDGSPHMSVSEAEARVDAIIARFRAVAASIYEQRDEKVEDGNSGGATTPSPTSTAVAPSGTPQAESPALTPTTTPVPTDAIQPAPAETAQPTPTVGPTPAPTASLP
jgi:hypothetical protein